MKLEEALEGIKSVFECTADCDCPMCNIKKKKLLLSGKQRKQLQVREALRRKCKAENLWTGSYGQTWADKQLLRTAPRTMDRRVDGKERALRFGMLKASQLDPSSRVRIQQALAALAGIAPAASLPPVRNISESDK